MVGNDKKHEYYDLLNLLGYGLAKFDKVFISEFGFQSKNDFYHYLIELGVCKTVGTIKNRQDMLDPFFDNGRKGWWQKRDQYISRKLFIDNLFGNEGVKSFAQIVKLYLQEQSFNINFEIENKIAPVIKSKFRKMQETGSAAELYFFNNYNNIQIFKNGKIQDVRLYGDGYDFQIEQKLDFFLAEVKGLKTKTGSFRMTDKEFERAVEYQEKYILIMVSNIIEKPKFTMIENPTKNLNLKRNIINSANVSYHSQNIKW